MQNSTVFFADDLIERIAHGVEKLGIGGDHRPSNLELNDGRRADQRVDKRFVFLGLLNGATDLGAVALDLRQPAVTPVDRAPSEVDPGQAGVTAQKAVIVGHRLRAGDCRIEIMKTG